MMYFSIISQKIGGQYQLVTAIAPNPYEILGRYQVYGGFGSGGNPHSRGLCRKVIGNVCKCLIQYN